MNSYKTTGLIGIGIFLILTLQGLSFFSFKTTEEALLFTSLNSLWVYGISKYSSVLLIIVVFVLFLRRVDTFYGINQLDLRKLFLYSISAYLGTQLLGFALPFITSLYEFLEYFNMKANYYNDLDDHYILKELLIDSPAWLLRYGVIIALILQRINPKKPSDATEEI